MALNYGKCNDCTHYRAANPQNSPAVTLASLADSAEPEIYEELKRIAGEEHDRQQAESQRVLEHREIAIRELDRFDLNFLKPPPFNNEDKIQFNLQVKPRLTFQFIREPLAATYCATHASRGIFYMPEIKNWCETCTDFSVRLVKPVCRNCSHYRTTDSEKQRRYEAANLISSIAANSSDAASILQTRASEIVKGIGPAKANDLRTAYNAHGRLQMRLDYLPFCKVACPQCKGQKGNFDCAICLGQGEHLAQPEIFNRFGGCQLFQAAGSTHMPFPNDSTKTPGPSPEQASPQPQGPDLVTQPRALASLGLSPFQSTPAALAGGVRDTAQSMASQAVGFLFSHLRQAAKTNLTTPEPGSAPPPPSDPHEISEDGIDILIPGQPPLTNEMLRRSVAVAKVVVGGAMSPGAESNYSHFIGSIWRRQLSSPIADQLAFIRMYAGDRDDPAWRAEALRLFKSMAASARQGTSTESAPEPSGPHPSQATHPASQKACKNGHSNPGTQLFCSQCGKPLLS